MDILSKSHKLSEFFGSLAIGEIFGFSQAFKRDDVMSLAMSRGLRVTPPSKLTPERKQYGDYVLKVRGKYPAWDYLGQASCGEYKAGIAKRTLKCQSGYLNTHTIPKNSAYAVETISGTDKIFCVECITRKLTAHVKHIQYFLNRIEE